MGRLTPSFRKGVLPRLEWFAGRAGDLTAFCQLWEAEREQATSHQPFFPMAWVMPARGGVLPAGAAERSLFEWRVPKGQLAELLQGGCRVPDSENGEGTLEGPTFLWAGCFWRLMLVDDLSLGVCLLPSCGAPMPCTIPVHATFSLCFSMRHGQGLLEEVEFLPLAQQPMMGWFTHGTMVGASSAFWEITEGVVWELPLRDLRDYRSRVPTQLVRHAKPLQAEGCLTVRALLDDVQ